MIVLGLTGSIGMGKSTAGAMLETLGVPVHDADVSVHALLSPDGQAYTDVCAAFPYFEYPQIYGPKEKSMRPLDRKALGAIVFSDDEKRKRLESILHPYVQEDQQAFIRKQQALGRQIVVLDIPLLFETGADARVDYTITVTAPAHIQRQRVLDRPHMTEERLEAILARQMPDGDKCARSDYVVQTGLGRAVTMKALKEVLNDVKTK